MKPAALVGDIEAVILRTEGGVVALMQHQVYSLLSSQLKLNILGETVVLIGVSDRNPSVLVDEASVLAVDIQIVAVRVETTSACVEVSQTALVNIGAVGERVPGKTNLISQTLINVETVYLL